MKNILINYISLYTRDFDPKNEKYYEVYKDGKNSIPFRRSRLMKHA